MAPTKKAAPMKHREPPPWRNDGRVIELPPAVLTPPGSTALVRYEAPPPVRAARSSKGGVRAAAGSVARAAGGAARSAARAVAPEAAPELITVERAKTAAAAVGGAGAALLVQHKLGTGTRALPVAGAMTAAGLLGAAALRGRWQQIAAGLGLVGAGLAGNSYLADRAAKKAEMEAKRNRELEVAIVAMANRLPAAAPAPAAPTPAPAATAPRNAVASDLRPAFDALALAEHEIASAERNAGEGYELAPDIERNAWPVDDTPAWAYAMAA